MRFGIDVSACAKPDGCGIPHYIHNLLSQLAHLDAEDKFIACWRLSRYRNLVHIQLPQAQNFHLKPFSELLSTFCPGYFDVFHGPDARIPKLRGTKLVATIHDLLALTSDSFAPEKFRAKKLRRYSEIKERADAIIATTDTNRSEIIERLGVRPERVRRIYQGFTDAISPQPPEEIQRVRDKYGLVSPYILSTAGFSVRKNTLGILQAFELVAEKLPSHKLVIAGKKSYRWEECIETFERLERREVAQYLGFVPDEDMPGLFSGAELFLFPSHFEGFGHPVLEAMNCGIPVVAGNRGSLPEVAGGCALLVNPEAPRDIADATLHLLQDEKTRREFIEKGRRRASEFSWRRTAEQTLALYRELVG